MKGYLVLVAIFAFFSLVLNFYSLIKQPALAPCHLSTLSSQPLNTGYAQTQIQSQSQTTAAVEPRPSPTDPPKPIPAALPSRTYPPRTVAEMKDLYGSEQVDRFPFNPQKSLRNWRHKNVTDNNERRKLVRATIAAAYGAYEKHAMGFDEIKTIFGKTGNYSYKGVNWPNGGMALQIIDALDTLYIAGLHDEFNRAADYLEKHFKFKGSKGVSLFEITIRVVGGLLSAYALSGRESLLKLVTSVSNDLAGIYTQKYKGKLPARVGGNLAEIGTVQLEYRYLSAATGDETYYNRTAAFFDVINQHKVASDVHLIPERWTFSSFTGQVSLGASSDSYYEYLQKLWHITGHVDERYRKEYTDAAEAIVDFLVKPFNEDMSVIKKGIFNPKTREVNGRPHAEHLMCFVPGMLAIGARHLRPDSLAKKHLEAAKRTSKFCMFFHQMTSTGLAPDELEYRLGSDATAKIRHRNMLLRPETIESLVYMWRMTKDPMYREWGWRIYSAIEEHARVCHNCDVSAYSEADDANASDGSLHSSGVMSSWFLAETMKYMFLLFEDDDVLDFDCWTFNTEAHPFPRFPINGVNNHTIPEKCFKPPYRAFVPKNIHLTPFRF